MNKPQNIFYISAIPLLGFIAATYFATSWGAFYDGLNSDPEYVYLLNSLNILNGIAPKHVDHPGTTLQMLGSVVIFVTSQFDFSAMDINEKVLSNPEKYLHAIQYVLNFLILATWILLSHTLIDRTRKTWLLLPFNLGILATTAIYASMQRVSAEPLLVSITLLLGYFLIEYYFNGANKRKLPIFIGITLAAGLVTKITFAPMLLLVFIFDKRFDKLTALLSLLVASVILTIPIWDEISLFTQWIMDLATHSGKYGGGEEGLPSLQELGNNFKAIKSASYFLILTLAFISVHISMPSTTRAKKKEYSLAFLVVLAQILMTLKHPSPHYLVPAQIYGALIFALLLNDISRIKPIVSAAVIPILFWFGYLSILEFYYTVEQRITSERSYTHIAQKAKDLGCKIIPYYRSTSISYALGFGNRFAQYQYADTLSKLYPNFVSYHFWDNGLEDFYHVIPVDEYVSQLRGVETLCFIGTLNLDMRIPQAELVYVEGIYNIFTLDSSSPK